LFTTYNYIYLTPHHVMTTWRRGISTKCRNIFTVYRDRSTLQNTVPTNRHVMSS